MSGVAARVPRGSARIVFDCPLSGERLADARRMVAQLSCRRPPEEDLALAPTAGGDR